MFIRTHTNEDIAVLQTVEPVAHQEDAGKAERIKELRRQLYESIAQGNALEEAEEIARRKWRGR